MALNIRCLPCCKTLLQTPSGS